MHDYLFGNYSNWTAEIYAQSKSPVYWDIKVCNSVVLLRISDNCTVSTTTEGEYEQSLHILPSNWWCLAKELWN